MKTTKIIQKHNAELMKSFQRKAKIQTMEKELSSWKVRPDGLIVKMIAILFLPVIANAQTINVSPTSVQMWGKAPATTKVSAEYKNVELIGLYASKMMYDNKSAAYYGLFDGVFYKPLNVELGRLSLHGGAGWFFRRFPTVNGQHLNFTAEAIFSITNRIGVKAAHISDGFGILNKLNPGVDNIGISINLK